MKAYSHVFFDLDRTLWDFDLNTSAAIRELLKEWSLSMVDDPERFVDIYHVRNDYYWEQHMAGQLDKAALRYHRFHDAFLSFGLDDAQLSKAFSQSYIERAPQQTKLIEGSEEVLEYLKSKGYHLHIISNGFGEMQVKKMHHAGIQDYFTSIVTSEMTGKKKPHFAIFDYALSLNGAAREKSVMVGDDLINDIIGARDAGLTPIYFNPQKLNHSESALQEIHRLKELMELL